ncbi:MAG TPA: helix-turn-helix transcriptional regulator, partial [Ktedonobacteraceae bacterium]|nr:helix-turn-helix transcriptional regulator [Ktedonobacteraceae bacterium]
MPREKPIMATVSSLTFGTLLKRYRLAAGLTQEELADQATLSRRGIADLERGARTQPRKETVQLLV